MVAVANQVRSSACCLIEQKGRKNNTKKTGQAIPSQSPGSAGPYDGIALAPNARTYVRLVKTKRRVVVVGRGHRSSDYL